VPHHHAAGVYDTHKDSEDNKPVVRFKGLQCTKTKLRDQGHRFSSACVITKSRFAKRAKYEAPTGTRVTISMTVKNTMEPTWFKENSASPRKRKVLKQPEI
jgi:hypothetical protein